MSKDSPRKSSVTSPHDSRKDSVTTSAVSSTRTRADSEFVDALRDNVKEYKDIEHRDTVGWQFTPKDSPNPNPNVSPEINLFFLGTCTMPFFGVNGSMHAGGDPLCHLAYQKGMVEGQPSLLLKGVGTSATTKNSPYEFYTHPETKIPDGSFSEMLLGSGIEQRIASAMNYFVIPHMIKLFAKNHNAETLNIKINLAGHSRGAITTFATADCIEQWMKLIQNKDTNLEILCTQINRITKIDKTEIMGTLQAIRNKKIVYDMHIMAFDPAEGAVAPGHTGGGISATGPVEVPRINCTVVDRSILCQYSSLPPSVSKFTCWLASDERMNGFRNTIPTTDPKTEVTFKPVIGCHSHMTGMTTNHNSKNYDCVKRHPFLREAMDLIADLVELDCAQRLFDNKLPPLRTALLLRILKFNHPGFNETKKLLLQKLKLTELSSDMEVLNAASQHLATDGEFNELLYRLYKQEILNHYLSPTDQVHKKLLEELQNEMRADTVLGCSIQPTTESRKMYLRDLNGNVQILIISSANEHFQDHFIPNRVAALSYPLENPIGCGKNAFIDRTNFQLSQCYPPLPKIDPTQQYEIDELMYQLNLRLHQIYTRSIYQPIQKSNSDQAMTNLREDLRKLILALNKPGITPEYKNHIFAALIMKAQSEYNLDKSILIKEIVAQGISIDLNDINSAKSTYQADQINRFMHNELPYLSNEQINRSAPKILMIFHQISDQIRNIPTEKIPPDINANLLAAAEQLTYIIAKKMLKEKIEIILQHLKASNLISTLINRLEGLVGNIEKCTNQQDVDAIESAFLKVLTEPQYNSIPNLPNLARHKITYAATTDIFQLIELRGQLIKLIESLPGQNFDKNIEHMPRLYPHTLKLHHLFALPESQFSDDAWNAVVNSITLIAKGVALIIKDETSHKDADGHTPLHYLAMSGNLKLWQKLSSYQYKSSTFGFPYQIQELFLFEKVNRKGKTPMQVAAENGNFVLIDEFSKQIPKYNIVIDTLNVNSDYNHMMKTAFDKLTLDQIKKQLMFYTEGDNAAPSRLFKNFLVNQIIQAQAIHSGIDDKYIKLLNEISENKYHEKFKDVIYEVNSSRQLMNAHNFPSLQNMAHSLAGQLKSSLENANRKLDDTLGISRDPHKK